MTSHRIPNWWTADREDELRIHVASKMSAREIFIRMGAPSRGCISKKCCRLGLRLEGKYVTPQHAWWTPQRVEELKVHCANKMSALEICTRMGAISRNSVIGKCRRLGLQLGGSHAHFADGTTKYGSALFPPRAPRKPPRRRVSTLVPGTRVAEPPAPAQLEIARAQFVAAEKRSEADSISAIDGVAIFAVREDQCRWPLNWPSPISEFRFCGKHTDGGPYCSTHHARAFARPRTFAEAAE